MTSEDERNDEQADRALREAARTQPDPGAREGAVDAALEAFDEEMPCQGQDRTRRQAILPWRRPKGESSRKGLHAMTSTRRNRILGSVAAACVTLFVVAFIWQYGGQPFGPGAADEPADTDPAGQQQQLAGTTREPAAGDSSAAAPESAREPATASVEPSTGRAATDRAAEFAGDSGPEAARPDQAPPAGQQPRGRDQFEDFETNPVKRVEEKPVSTFSVDVDTASYSFVRRQLNQGRLPQKDAVRVEEMINYFDYAYPVPEADQAFATHTLVQDSPWKADSQLIHIGIKGRPVKKPPQTNLVFLLDVSGSMNNADRLPLVKQSMEMLLKKLDDNDRVAIVVYAGSAGTVLEPTEVKNKQKVLDALDELEAGGSTAGAEGIKRAYELARNNYDPEAVNRVMLATDGDFNVGITDQEELKSFVERQKDEGIFLSVLGFGQGNYQDQRMQALAQNGNGVAAYIDTLSEAQKVLVHEATSALYPIARDVKIQVQFNPDTVQEYRLLGYETRQLDREDFNNDAVDAGDIGAGHTVTAIYEVTPVGAEPRIEPSRYDESEAASPETAGKADEYGFLRLRYKEPEGDDESNLIEEPIRKPAARDQGPPKPLAREANFATAVAGFAQLLRGGQYTGDWDFDDALDMAQANKGPDRFGYRTEFIQLIRKAKMADAM